MKFNSSICRLLSGLLLLAATAVQSAQTITLASTTSTEASGLFSAIVPAFRRDTGINVKVVAVGTGQAIDIARRGDADVLLVHDREKEEAFVREGFGLRRSDVMFNDFVLIGPAADPAKARGRDILEGLRRVAASSALFVSRGDKSGTDAAERRYWQSAGIGQRGLWLRECGCGMGQALNTASGMSAYVLSDRATWANFKNRGDLTILVEADPALFNPYGVVVVNPARHPQANAKGGQVFADWITSKRGQDVIAGHRVGSQQLFFGNAK
jgi:ABC-type tungstate transport system, permease component